MVIAAGWFLMRPKQDPSATPTATSTPYPQESPSQASDGAAVQEQMVVEVTKDGFSPQNIVISKGQSVIWQNKDTKDHTVDSDTHPTHLIYPPLNLGLIRPGQSKSLNFPAAGTYQYHDHLNPSLTGSVAVQ